MIYIPWGNIVILYIEGDLREEEFEKHAVSQEEEFEKQAVSQEKEFEKQVIS